MSSAPEPVERLVRTVSKSSKGGPNAEMSTVGWLMAVALLFLVVPFAPVIAAVWLLSKAAKFLTRQTRGGM
ncbi:DUF7535 family protein [Halobacterium jilantaiense]|uniref:Uncharacterized protein n=1 Tax=Halobacterium jilantaiense TaxID=355548 RepID=A0A1I0PW85_9EURY|nr:hypothetical protein [Halobacterium jilantaiense]SEW18782.1 hypothetical protein SAMN04487945_2030 [Halobacterium jilantaiense]